MRNSYFGGCGRRIARGVSDQESDRIDTTIAAAFTLSAQLHRLTVRGDHDVVHSVAIAIAILNLVAGHQSNHHAVEIYVRVKIVAGACRQIANLDRVVTVVRRPERNLVAVQSNRWSD